MNFVILFVVSNSFLILNVNTNRILELDENELTKEIACHLSRNHWILVKWYFNRCTYAEITEIALNKSHNSNFSDYIIRKLMNETRLAVKTFIVDQFYDEPNITYADTIGRNSIRFEPWETFRNTSYTPMVRQQRHIRQNTRFTFKSNVRNARHDEPELAAFVYADSFDIIEEYLQGPPRQPFYRPRANFIINLTQKVQINWRESAATILEKLWRDYRVLNAIIMMPCEEEHIIGFYDPFDPDPDTVLDHKLKDNWGAMKWVALTDIDHGNGWLLMKGTNFKGYPFKASMFTRFPTMVESSVLPKSFLNTFYANGVKNSGGVAGFDGLVLGNLAKAFNFTTVRVTSISYGAMLPDHTFAGSMGDVLYRRADANLNGRFIVDYESQEIEFLYPVFSDKFCVIAPAALQIPGWMAIFRCYSMGVWSGILATVIVCTIYWYFLKNIETKIHLNEKGCRPEDLKYFKLNYIFTDMVMLITGGPVRNTSFRSMERIFIGSCLIFNIVIAGTFQGSLTTSFSTSAYEADIDTLEQLDQSGLPIITSANTIKNFFGTDDNPVRNSLSKKYFVANITAIEIAAYERRMCTIERFSDIRIIIKTIYEDANGKSSLHVVKECPRDYHLGYIVRKGFPFAARFKTTLLRFFESGLLMQWYNEIENALIAQKATKKLAVDPVFSFNLEDMQTAFYILGIGWLTCLTAFILEKIFPNLKYL